MGLAVARAKHAIAGDGIGDTNLPWPGTDFDNYPCIEENGWEDPEPPEPPIISVPDFSVLSEQSTLAIIMLLTSIPLVYIFRRKMR